MMQIAGAMTRGILPWRAPGDVLQRGDCLGMIRLGSRSMSGSLHLIGHPSSEQVRTFVQVRDCLATSTR